EREKLITELNTVNAKLQEESAERKAVLQRTNALYQIVRSLIISEDLDDMLQVVTHNIAKILNADQIVLATLNLDTREVTHIVQNGLGTEQYEDLTYDELMEGLTGWVVDKVQPVLSPNGMPDPRESTAAQQRRRAANWGAVMVVPLYFQGKILGTLTAINRPDRRDFDRNDLLLLNAVAGQISVALSNVQLSAETARMKRFNESIVQGVAEAIFITDAHNMIKFANPAAVAMLGYEAKELVGTPTASIVAEKYLDKFWAEFELRQEGISSRYEMVLCGKDNTHVPVLVSACPLFQEDMFTGTLAAFTDITELKQAEATLRQYTADLQAQNAELDAFAHTVAHDLKGPLSILVGFTQLLESKAGNYLPDKHRDQLGIMAQTGQKMRNIIDELLLLASVREMEDIDLVVLDMNAIVDAVCNRLAYMIEEHQAEVVVTEEWPYTIGYGPWIEEVWVNYLSNALKYGGRPDDGVVPYVELGFDNNLNGDETHIRFWVRDNGVGLYPDQQVQLFTPFERLHNVKVKGHGLGLSIVRRIVEKLGGEVGIESKVGAGSTFYFTLPIMPKLDDEDIVPG
ncbi:MAG: PAS domain S-box protein, partial [Anaerolineae bacterium]|nr:PAS domain S-box protein [Anaerolineae bacterium]